MTTPEGVHRWLNRRRMDAAVRAAVLDANSAAVRAIRRALADVDIKATPQDVAQWFASRLNTDATPVPAAESLALLPAARRKPPRAEPRSGADKRDEVADESSSDMPKQHVIRLSDLIQAGILAPNTELLLLKGSQIRATASVNADGSIMYSGHNYRTPSNKEFARLLGWPSINGWDRWHVEFPEGRVSLSDLRTRLNPDSSLG
jgi:hypothetical protein